MASGGSYLEFIKDQLSHISGVSFRAMMGEYIIYYNGKVLGGIYDDRFLVKITPAARALMPHAHEEIPYPGGSAMLGVDDPDDREFLSGLFEKMYPELPERIKRKRK